MKKFFDKFFRKDLELNKKWRHRLFKVLFFIIIIISLIISTYIAWDENEPWHPDYYEVVWSLSDYISEHSNEWLVNLEDILWINTYIFNKDSGNWNYEIWDFISKPYIYYQWIKPDWIITDNDRDVDRLKHMQCKNWMTIDDILKYKYEYTDNDGKYYSRVSRQCEVFSNDLFYENQEIMEANCIYLDESNNCMVNIWKNSEFMNQFIVIDRTDTAIKYCNKWYYEDVFYLLWVIFKNIWIILWIAILLVLIYYKWIIYIIYWGWNKK